MKQLLIGYFLREVLQKTVIEILQYACSMMGPDKIDDRLRKFPLFGDLDSANDVVFDDTGAFFKREFIVRVEFGVLVLDEIKRALHLADIVIQSTCADEQWITTDLECHRLGQVGYLERMLEGPGAL